MLSREDCRLVGPVVSWGRLNVEPPAWEVEGVAGAGPLAPPADPELVDQSEATGPVPRGPCLLARFVTLRSFSSMVFMGPCYREHQFALLLLGHSSSRSSSSWLSSSSSTRSFLHFARIVAYLLSFVIEVSQLGTRDEEGHRGRCFTLRLFCLPLCPLVRPPLINERWVKVRSARRASRPIGSRGRSVTR